MRARLAQRSCVLDAIGGGRVLGADDDPEIDHEGEQDAGDDPRHDAGDQELADRGLGGDAVDHHGDARRNQNVERRADADCARRQLVGIAVAAHFRHGDLGHHRGRGRAGARHGAENAAGEHGGDGEPAPDVRAPVGGGGVEVAGEPARGREERHQDEHGDRGQRVVGHRAERRQADDAHHLAEVAGDEIDAEHAGARERDRDRHAEHERENQHEQRKRDHVRSFRPMRATRKPAHCGSGRLFPEQVGLAAAHAREVDEHDRGQRQEAQRDEAIGRPDQDRQRAQLGVVAQSAQRLLAWSRPARPGRRRATPGGRNNWPRA